VTAREFRAFVLFLLCIFTGVIAVHVYDALDEWEAAQEAQQQVETIR
jgi:hypothetical protein